MQYKVHFSFYSEEYGYFDETALDVEAENTFEARRKAWSLCDNNDNMKLASNIKLCGITWDASPIDMQRYFNAEAAYENYRFKVIENVEIPNATISNSTESMERYKTDKYSCFAALQTINQIACDFGKPHGMISPIIYDELHYANKFVNFLYYEGKSEQADALWKRIESAKKWDSGSMYNIRDIFRNSYAHLNDEIVRFKEQFGKDGIYPDVANPDDGEYKYISRWQHKHMQKSLAHLLVYGEKDVIQNSRNIDYNYQHILLDKELLRPEHQKPENLIWYVDPDTDAYKAFVDSDKHSDIICAKNAITGEDCEWDKKAFIGVLRPDIVAHIDFETLQNEYKQSHVNEQDVAVSNDMSDEEMEDYEP